MAANSRVFMAAVRYATFQKDRIALSRRDAQIPRQTCTGDLCEAYQPDMVLCENLGADGNGGYTWQCKAELPQSVHFGELSVSCEGWDGPDDLFVLDGSCAVTYELIPSPSFSLDDDRPKLPSRTDRLSAQAFDVVFYSMTFVILYTILRKLAMQHAPRWTPPRLPFMPDDQGGGGGPGGPGGPGGGGGGGGAGGNGHGDHDPLRKHDTDTPDTFDPDIKPSSQVDTAGTGTQIRPSHPHIQRAGIIGGVLAATGLGALFATQRPAEPAAPTGQRQRPQDNAASAVAGPSRTQESAARMPSGAQTSQRIGTGEAARRRQTYEGFWGVDTGMGDDRSGGDMRTATAFGSSHTR